MIQVDDPPDVKACASCHSPLLWLYSFRTGRTFSVVAVDNETLKVHGCQHAQDAVTWRSLRRGTPPTAEYVEARAELKERSGEEQT